MSKDKKVIKKEVSLTSPFSKAAEDYNKKLVAKAEYLAKNKGIDKGTFEEY
jgi:hypothetical protein